VSNLLAQPDDVLSCRDPAASVGTGMSVLLTLDVRNLGYGIPRTRHCQA
jgi:hypothetical protein